jgi:hypothetical protein
MTNSVGLTPTSWGAGPTDHLLARRRTVRHIIGPGQIQDAALTPGAVPRADGTVRYPPQQGSLL